jgi:hypothetical protein
MLKIRKALQDLIPPLSPDEFSQLEENILAENRCRHPLKIWRGYIIDGFNRHAICTKHNIPFQTQTLPFKSENEAKIWIAENQLGRRNLTDATRIEIAAAKIKLQPQAKPFNRRKAIAEAASVSEQTVSRYMKITGSGAPELIQKVRSGELKIGTAYTKLSKGKKVYLSSTTRKKLYNKTTHGISNPATLGKNILHLLDTLEKTYTDLLNGDFERYSTPDFPKLGKLMERQYMGFCKFSKFISINPRL